MKKQTKGNKTKQHLYRQAMLLFRERGYDNVSVDEIVKAAGTAKGTFYVHFDSKMAVIAQMFQEYDDYYDAIEAQLDPSQPVMERLEIFIGKSCQFTQEIIGLDMLRTLYRNQLGPDTLEHDNFREDRSLYRIIHRLLLEGQRDGLYRADLSVTTMGAWLVRCIRGTFYEWIMREGSFDLREECIHYVRMFFQGIETRN